MKKIYYFKSEALKAAEEMKAENVNYTIRKGAIDDSCDVDESDSFVERVKGSWAGEVPAFVVEDDNYNVIAKFGWWADED